MSVPASARINGAGTVSADASSPNASIDSRGPSGPSGCHDPRPARSDSFSVSPSSLPAGRRLSLATTGGIEPEDSGDTARGRD